MYGTGTPGASVRVTLTGPNSYTFTIAPVTVASSSDVTIHGSWKALLPAQSAGFGYAVVATCAGCSNATSPPASLTDVGFGDVFLCSGQSNSELFALLKYGCEEPRPIANPRSFSFPPPLFPVEVPVLTTIGRFEFYNRSAAGDFDHIRLFQTGWRWLGPRKGSSWILPVICSPNANTPCEDDGGGYAYRSWLLPRSSTRQSDDDGGHDTAHFPDRFSAVCWYFGATLSDSRANETADPVPIGLISSNVGGTMIQQWLPPWATGNDTCTENNCGWVEQLNPGSGQPACNMTTADVWSCPTGTCSTLWHTMIAPFVNMSQAGILWYQGEQNQPYTGGNATSGYACLQKALISSWRAAFSTTPSTTPADVPFGVTSLAGGGSEGFPVWSPSLHTTEAWWFACYSNGGRNPGCFDIIDDSMGGMRRAQSGGAGAFPADSNIFMAQAHDLGEPCLCDTSVHSPGGCWASDACFGEGPYSLNITWNYQNSGIHPRNKQQVGQRMARSYVGLLSGGAAVPKFAGCRLDAASGALTLTFDSALLKGEAVGLQTGFPGLIPLEVRTSPPNNTATGWVYALGLQVVNATSIAVTLPSGGPAPDAVRYAWANYPCCPGIDSSTFFCPSEACPIVTATTTAPAIPFWANIIDGKCVCEAPWVCDA